MSARSRSTIVDRGLLVACMVLAAVFAGCAKDEDPAPTGPTSQTGSGVTADPTPAPVAPKPKGTSERWHFHDSWKGLPTIVLLDRNVTFNATAQGPDGLPALSAIVDLPPGVTVPAETGFLTVNVTWEPATTGLVNVTFRPADSNDFQPAGEAARGVALVIGTTESMCDVPHRQQSFWKFNFTSKPGGSPPAVPAKDVRVVITATIGRPLFIDPPHLDWWQGGDTIPLVAGAKGEVATATTRAGNVTLPGTPAPGTVPTAGSTVRVPVDVGRIVPEGAKSIVAILNWTTDVPGVKLQLAFKEGNLPSEGLLTVAKDGAGSRVFTLPVQQAQTDTTYSNRTTWEFTVKPDGQEGAFKGTFTLVAWTSRLQPEAAVAVVAAT